MKYEAKQKLLHLFFPTRCPVCGEFIYPGERFCSECEDRFEHYNGSFSINGTASFTAPLFYDETTSPAIIRLKRGIRGNADFALGGELADKLIENGIVEGIDMMIPIPMFKSDMRKRTYNQSELIANAAARILKKPVRADILIKNRKTLHQKELDGVMRRKNLTDAFTVVKPADVKGRSILLIDDVCTTGSTLLSASKALSDAGAKEIHCAVCCKTH